MSSVCWSWGGGVPGVAWNDLPTRFHPNIHYQHRLWWGLSLCDCLGWELLDEYGFDLNQFEITLSVGHASATINILWLSAIAMQSEMCYGRQERCLLCVARPSSWVWSQNRITYTLIGKTWLTIQSCYFGKRRWISSSTAYAMMPFDCRHQNHQFQIFGLTLTVCASKVLTVKSMVTVT